MDLLEQIGQTVGGNINVKRDSRVVDDSVITSQESRPASTWHSMSFVKLSELRLPQIQPATWSTKGIGRSAIETVSPRRPKRTPIRLTARPR